MTEEVDAFDWASYVVVSVYVLASANLHGLEDS